MSDGFAWSPESNTTGFAIEVWAEEPAVGGAGGGAGGGGGGGFLHGREEDAVPYGLVDDSLDNSTTTSTVDVAYMAYLVSEVVVAVLAVVGNALTLTVFAIDRKLRRLTNYYIASLALADLLVGVLGVPFAILTYLGIPQHLSACLLMLSTLIVLCTISIFCLVAVSLDRYWAILHPLMYSRLMTRNIARRVIVCCWVAGGIVGLLPMAGWHQDMDGLCLFTQVMDYSFLVFLYFATIVGPGILMAAFYTLIYSVVIKQAKLFVRSEHGTLRQISAQESVYEDQHRLQIQMQTDLQGSKAQPGVCPEGNSEGGVAQNDGAAMAEGRGRSRRGSIMQQVVKQVTHASRREVKAAKNLSIIVLFFMICWFPLYTINCINAFCDRCTIPLHVTNFTIILSHANSAINPFLYAYHMKDFRYALKVLVLGRIMGRKVTGKDPYLRGSHLVSPHHSTWHRVGAGNQRSSALHTPHTRTPPAALTPFGGSPFDPVSRSRASTVDSQAFRPISRAVSSAPSLQQELCSLSPDYRQEGSTTSASKGSSLNPYIQRSQARPRAATLMSHTAPFSSSSSSSSTSTSKETASGGGKPRRPVSLLTDYVPASQTIFEAKSPSQPNVSTETQPNSPVIVKVGYLETVRHVYPVPVVSRSNVDKEVGDPPPTQYSEKSIFSLTTNFDVSSANDHGDDVPTRRSSCPQPRRIQNQGRNSSDAVTIDLCDKKTINSVMDKICASNKRAFSYTGCANGNDTMCELNIGSGRIASKAISNATGHKKEK